jgi:ketosteroid isomerase-like protein
MHTFRGLFLLITAIALLPAAVTGQGPKPDPAFEAAVARLRASVEKDKRLPADLSFYAETLHTGHNWDTGRTVKAQDLTKMLPSAYDHYAKENGITKMELTRFVASGDTVVTAVLETGKKPDGTPTRLAIATFYRLANGKIVDIQEWYDRSERDQRPYIR